MPFNILSSLQSETDVFEIPVPRVNFANFLNFTTQFNTDIGANKVLGIPTLTQCGNSTLAVSDSGQYMCASTNGSGVGIAVSSNYGQNWTYTAGFTGQTASYACCMSSDGVYMYQILSGATTNQVRYSHDNGANWTFVTIGPVATGRMCQCSKTGQFVIASTTGGNEGLWYSKDYGVSFTHIASTGASYLVSGSYSAWINNDGKTIVLANTNNTILVKATDCLDASGNINTSPSFSSTGIGTTDTNNKTTIEISDDMKYWLIVSRVSSNNNAWVSSNYGASFTLLSSLGVLPTALGTGGYGYLSGDGRNMFVAFNGGYPYYSNNYGASWTKITTLPPSLTTTFLWNSSVINRTGTWALMCNNSDITTFANKLFIASNQ